MPCSDHAVAAKPSWLPSLLASPLSDFTTQEVLDDREECKTLVSNRDEDSSSGNLIGFSVRQKRKSVLATGPPGKSQYPYCY